MRDPDEAVQKLLVSLRDAKPAAGMEQRVLAAVQHATEASPGGRRIFWSGCWRYAPAMLVAAAAVLLTAGWVLLVTGQPKQQTLTRVINHPALADAGQVSKPFERARKPASLAGHVTALVAKTQTSAPASRHHAHAGVETASRSYPAPPLPLTQQERLLVRVARRRDPGSLNILNPDVQGAQTARATEQFQRFFSMNHREMRTQLE